MLALPIANTLTTKLIADLALPTVIMFPSKSYHTVLNYDLMKADNQTRTEEQRRSLKKLVEETFIQKPHLD